MNTKIEMLLIFRSRALNNIRSVSTDLMMNKPKPGMELTFAGYKDELRILDEIIRDIKDLNQIADKGKD